MHLLIKKKIKHLLVYLSPIHKYNIESLSESLATESKMLDYLIYLTLVLRYFVTSLIQTFSKGFSVTAFVLFCFVFFWCGGCFLFVFFFVLL